METGNVQPQKKEADKFFGLSALSSFLSNKMFLNFLPQSARESGQDETFHPFHLFLSKHGHSFLVYKSRFGVKKTH